MRFGRARFQQQLIDVAFSFEDRLQLCDSMAYTGDTLFTSTATFYHTDVHGYCGMCILHGIDSGKFIRANLVEIYICGIPCLEIW